MPDAISWIHLTDLHSGQSNDWLWPSMRQQFYEDLKVMAKAAGPWDIVFFSGDFVQRGAKEEFNEVRNELERLWRHFRTLRSEPLLVCVPGNHDLERPRETDPITRQSHRWHEKDEAGVKAEFWAMAKSPYRKAVAHSFKNFSAWRKSLSIPQPPLDEGMLPGDFATILGRKSFKLGIIGLNTTFLQLDGGDYLSKLDLHVKQLHAVCRNEPQPWREGVDLAVLMTHQPPNWLHALAREQLSEIYTLGKFDTHLAGHLHEPEMHDTREAGGAVRRIRQGASLFGLNEFGIAQTRPLFGYMLGKWELDGTTLTEQLWPRRATTTRDGMRRVAPDTEYHLDVENRVITQFQITRAIRELRRSYSIHTLAEPSSSILASTGERERRVVHPEKPTDEEVAKLKSKDLPRFRLQSNEQHRAIRADGQERLAEVLRQRFTAWLVCDWGLGKDGFLSCALQRFAEPGPLDIFCLQCGSAETCLEIQDLSQTQLGLSFQEFCAAIAPLERAVLIFDDMPSAFSVGPEHSSLEKELIAPIRRFCPNLRMIFVVRQEPRDSVADRIVVLRALEIHETREYIKHHRHVQRGLEEPETLERIQSWSEGLPMRLDQLMEQLQVFSLSELLNEGGELSGERSRSSEPIPRALRDAVEQLANASTAQGRQSFRLLKVLTVLRDGEVFQAIRRFYPAEPFYLSNVSELIDLALLEAVPIAQTAAELSPRAGKPYRLHADTPKLLRVPRQVRDYVGEIISEEERQTILGDSTELLFGKTWRNGEIELRKDLDESYSGSSMAGPGNEHVVVQYLIFQALHSGEDLQIKRTVQLGLRLCSKLLSSDRFRDAVIATGTMVHLLRETPLRREFAESARMHGSALRMMYHEGAAIEISKIALEQGDEFYTDSAKASIHLTIALAYADSDQDDQALAAVHQALKLAPENSASRIQAEALLAKLTIEDPAKLDRRLRHLLGRARKKGHDETANNITLDLIRGGKQISESLRELEKVFSTAKGNYMRTLAIVQKASLLAQFERSNELTDKDRELLSAAYNYAYAQRIGNLLERCHKVLWDLFSLEGVWSSMLRLFRLSSFFWTLRGAKEKETEYVRELDAVDLDELKRLEGRTLDAEILYLKLRRQDYPIETPQGGDEGR